LNTGKGEFWDWVRKNEVYAVPDARRIDLDQKLVKKKLTDQLDALQKQREKKKHEGDLIGTDLGSDSC
jgi:hypothetical protein